MIGITFAVAALFAVPALSQDNAANEREDMECPCPQRSMGMGMSGHCPSMHMAHGMSPAAWIMSMGDTLNLNDDQLKQLAEQDTQFKMKQVDRKAAIAKKMIQMKETMRSDTVSKDQLKPMFDEIAKGYVDMAMAWVDAKDQAKKVLTPEQASMLKSTKYGMAPCPMTMRQREGKPRAESAPKGGEKQPG